MKDKEQVETIKEKYPKAYAKLVERYKGAEIPAGITIDEFVDATILLAHRVLFDFFDENKLYITTDFLPGNFNWFCYIMEENGEILTGSEELSSRTEAEKVIITEAFKLLETKLQDNGTL